MQSSNETSQQIGGTSATKRHPLVLIHGLRNAHRWTPAFLRRCLEIWGSGRVYVVHLNRSGVVWDVQYPEGVVHCAGSVKVRAGSETIDTQFGHLRDKLTRLEAERGLVRPFDVIAHSMGGLVLRRYVAEAPADVAAAVTLGTPHGGAPMAQTFRWLGRGLRSGGAFDNLTPGYVRSFVQSHPWPASVPLYTVRAIARRGWIWGVSGELWLGYHYHRWRGMDSDGLVPVDSALCQEGVHLADLEDGHHLQLTSDPAIVDVCASVLP